MVATTDRSALAAAGSSGGESGSNQSPNWNPVSQTPSEDSSDSTCRTWEVMDSYWLSSTPASPYAVHNAHGTHTAASLQMAVDSIGSNSSGWPINLSTSGTTNGTTPEL